MKHDLVPFRGVFEILRRAPLSFLYGSPTWVHIDLSDVTVSRKTLYIEKTAVALRGMRMSALRNEWLSQCYLTVLTELSFSHAVKFFGSMGKKSLSPSCILSGIVNDDD